MMSDEEIEGTIQRVDRQAEPLTMLALAWLLTVRDPRRTSAGLGRPFGQWPGEGR